MTPIINALAKFTYDIIIILAKMPFLIVMYSFTSFIDMGEYSLAEERLNREKDRGTVFVISDNKYTKIN